MVKLKYPAIYSDDLGGDKAFVYFGENNVELKVRGFTFYSEYNDFDFYTKDINRLESFFNLKDDELVEYVLDVRIPFILTYGNTEYTKKLLLRIERQKNYYSNSLILSLDDNIYKVEDYDFRRLLIKMNKMLPREYKIKSKNLYLFERKELKFSYIM